MILHDLQRALSIASGRFGTLGTYSVCEADSEMPESDITNADISKQKIFVRKDESSPQNLFHDALYNLLKADIRQRRALQVGIDEQYFNSLDFSSPTYGLAVYCNLWLETFYKDLFPDFVNTGGYFWENRLEKYPGRKAGYRWSKVIFEQAGTPKAYRAKVIYLTRPEFETIDKGWEKLLKLNYQEIIRTLESEKWTIKRSMPPKFPEDLKIWAMNVLQLSKIVDVPVGKMRADAYSVLDFVKNTNFDIGDDVREFGVVARKILSKKRQGESLYAPASSNFDSYDGLNVVEFFSRILEQIIVLERRYGEIATVLEREKV